MRRIGGLAALLVLGALSVTTHQTVRDARAEFPRDADVLYLPPPQHLQPMSLGYREALADLIWIRAVIFAGDRIGATNYSWIMEYLEAIYTLSPQFRRPYAWGGVAFIYSGEAIDRDMVDRAIELYRRGIAHFPEDHELLFALGMLLTRDVQSVAGYDEVERELAMEEGTALIRKAAAFGAPPLVRQLAATLVTQGGADQLAIQFLESQLMQAEDEEHRRLLRQKLESVVGEAGFEQVQRLRADFEAEHQADLPYVHPDLYVLLRD
ncbi:hypothetical protein PPSIR1_16275 [Plesiocystis pacifica SIR-1]|uniref:Uncharacterized protein n=1 Tax=Plesiocystis pacifica SIR-1 TaxID=391625 RepID=A6GJX6_9BACT|nr:hypothetical protein [Plesiocystis pacifica]EDM73835.1 hypothetical protein PPSIR1_16275 [Plesiocystis pacifica SIR-1]